MKYFVTGATGFVGGGVVRQLREAGHEVHAVVRNPEKAKVLKNLGVIPFTGDMTDKESMRVGMQGTDGVFHIAGWYKVGTRDKRDGERVNIQGTRNVLELMNELGIPKGVYTSTLGVNSDTHGKIVDESYRFTGKHITEYDRTKAAAHQIAEQFIAQGLPLVIVMPSGTYGPGDTSILRHNIIDFLKGRLPILPETYIIAGEPWTYWDAFQLASHITGKRAPIAVPYQIFKALSFFIKPFDSFLPEMYTSEAVRALGGVTYWGDNSKARRELGYVPRPLRDGLEETLRHEMSLLGMN